MTEKSVKSIPIFTRGVDRPVAILCGDVLHKSIKGSIHFLRHPTTAIAINTDVLEQAWRRGGRIIIVKDRETGATYETTIRHLLEHGERLERGYGEQAWLGITEWAVTERPASLPDLQPRLL